MKPTSVKKLRVAVGGLAMLALSGMFNAAAQAQDVTPAPAPAPVIQLAPVDAPAPVAARASMAVTAQPSAINQQLFDQIQALGSAIDAIVAADEHARYKDAPALQAQVDGIIATLDAGADGNLYTGDHGLSFLKSNGLSAFSAGVILAMQLDRPDLVDSFIAHGADPSQVAPDQWTPMDYALVQFYGEQMRSRSGAEAAFRVVDRLLKAGAQVTDAKQIADGKLTELKDVVASLAGAEIMESYGYDMGDASPGLIIGGSDAVRQDLSDETELRAQFLLDHGATLVTSEYTDAYPGGPEPYEVQDNDTLESVAARYYVVMGKATPDEAVQAIVAQNNIDLNGTRNAQGQLPLTKGNKILLPVPVTVQVGTVQFNRPVPVLQFAQQFARSGMFFMPNVAPEEVAREIARINGLDEARAVDGTLVFAPQVPIVIPYRNDSYDHVKPLVPPAQVDADRRVDLVIIEGKDYHQKRTYGVATSTGYGINPDVDFSRFTVWDALLLDYPSPGEADALRALLADPQNPLRDRLVFSHSMGFQMRVDPKSGRTVEEVLDARRQAGTPDSVNVETVRMLLDDLEAAAPIIFTASGNEHQNNEGPYRGSFVADFSPRAVNVGAAGKYPFWHNLQLTPAYVISPYSSFAADICAPLPSFNGEQQEGTSFSTPEMASLYRQMSEWYGDRLSFEEIMAAAMLTADHNVLDYDRPDSVFRSVFPTQFTAHMAKFKTNGAGLAYHDRCGAGVLDLERWNDTLKLMLDLKTRPGLSGAAYSENLSIGAATLVPGDQSQNNYVYRVRVPEDMTLGNLTFVLTQYPGAHSESIKVRTPSGFEQELPRSASDIVQSYAFAYEDVKAGQFIEIISDKELAPNAELVLRGQTGDNLIARLRDELRAQGALPAPNAEIGGQQVTVPPTVKSSVPQGDGQVNEGGADDDHIVPDFANPPTVLPRPPQP